MCRVFGILNDGIGRTVAGNTGTRKSGSFSWAGTIQIAFGSVAG